jgi:hypothetical protein
MPLRNNVYYCVTHAKVILAPVVCCYGHNYVDDPEPLADWHFLRECGCRIIGPFYSISALEREIHRLEVRRIERETEEVLG